MVYPEPTVGGLVVNEGGDLLLVRSWKWRNKLTVPGGHIELGERVQDAVKREVKEETGLDVEPVKLLMVQEAIFSDAFTKRKHFIFLDYLCRVKEGEVRLDGTELQEYIWAKPEEALEFNLEEFTRNLIVKYLAEEKSRRR